MPSQTVHEQAERPQAGRRRRYRPRFDPETWSPPAPVTVRRIEPTGAPPTRPQNRSSVDKPESRTVRVEQTAALAAQLAIVGTTDEVATQLRERAADDLAAIWGGLPGVRWLADAITAAPLAWARGMNAVGEQ